MPHIFRQDLTKKRVNTIKSSLKTGAIVGCNYFPPQFLLIERKEGRIRLEKLEFISAIFVHAPLFISSLDGQPNPLDICVTVDQYNRLYTA